jgi:predicted lysophospholipase L1 biosynthesis ABC-type transport system permease subunit
MRIVGRAVFPRLGQGSFTPTDLGEGAATTNAALIHLLGTPVPDDPSAKYSVYFVRYRSGVDTAAEEARLQPRLAEAGIQSCPSAFCFQRAERPGTLDNYARVRSTGWILLAVLGLLACGSLAHALVTSIRRRRRDLAILKTLGLQPGRIARATAWQATTTALVAIVFGIPTGVVAGRWLWSAFASQIGVGASATVPMLGLLITAVAAIFAANVVAYLPGRFAATTPPAVVLRSE